MTAAVWVAPGLGWAARSTAAGSGWLALVGGGIVAIVAACCSSARAPRGRRAPTARAARAGARSSGRSRHAASPLLDRQAGAQAVRPSASMRRVCAAMSSVKTGSMRSSSGSLAADRERRRARRASCRRRGGGPTSRAATRAAGRRRSPSRSSSTSSVFALVDVEQQRRPARDRPSGSPAARPLEEVVEESGGQVAGDEDLVPVGALGAALEVVELGAERLHRGDRVDSGAAHLGDECSRAPRAPRRRRGSGWSSPRSSARAATARLRFSNSISVR